MSAAAKLNQALAGRYRIEREIGRGGMATVFLAEDLRHKRRVAVKVLEAELGALLGSERFLAEIQVTANLQHPNLLPLFDSGEADGLLYYVMPFIEGESLRVRLEREKQLPIDDAVRIATGIAGALAYAHRHGVIHRDLKPENILLHDGQPLVADFGIALAVSKAGGTRVTQTGISLGTPQYMSPEQATGDRQLDGRSDIYSLGAVLYEMLAGEPPFTGQTAHSLIAKLLTDEPRSIRLTRPSVAPRLEAIVLRALAKLPADRFQTAQEMMQALQGDPVILPEGVVTPGGMRVGTGARHARRRLGDPVTVTLAALLLVATALAGWLAARPSSPALVTRTSLALPLDMPLTGAGGRGFDISHDGTTIVYSSLFVEGGQQLYVRRLDHLQPRTISGMTLALDPRISPDGRWIAYASGAQLYKLSIDGGPAVFLSAGQTLGTEWVDDATVAGVRDSRIWLFNADGSGARPLTVLDSSRAERLQAQPVASGDGQLVFYQSTEARGANDARIAVASVKTGRSAALEVAGVSPIGTVDDALVYARADGAVMAVRIDRERLRAVGEPIPLGEQVTVVAGQVARASISATGTLVYQLGATLYQMMIVDSAGGQRRVLGEPRTFVHPRFSPDGRRVAMSFDGSVWIHDIASSTPMRMTSVGRSDRPEWSPDGRRVLYRSSRDGADQIWWQPADGSGRAERLHGDAQEAVMSPDGKWLIMRTIGASTKRDVRYRAVAGDTVTHGVADTEAEELMPRVSPDGRWVAYASDESGVIEVYVRGFPGPSGKVLVSLGGGTEPVWAPDSRRVYYRNGRAIVAANVSTTNGFSVVSRKTMFEGYFSSSPIHANFDVSPDGKSFVVVQPTNTAAQVIVVTNWASEVRARLNSRR